MQIKAALSLRMTVQRARKPKLFADSDERIKNNFPGKESDVHQLQCSFGFGDGRFMALLDNDDELTLDAL